MRRLPPYTPSMNRQRGSIIVPLVMSLLIGIILLGATQLAYMYVMKRELQNAADLAALAGAQRLTTSECALASSTALASAQANLRSGFDGSVTPVCGFWQPAQGAASDPRHFQPRGAGGPFNAVHVTVRGRAPALFSWPGSDQQVSVEAIARFDEPTAVFSVGSQLVNTNPEAPLMGLLRLVTGNTTLNLVSYRGLAGVNITPGGLLDALGIPVATDLGIGEFNSLLAGRRVSVGQVLDAIVTLADQQGLLGLNASLVNGLTSAGLTLDSLMVQLGSAANSGSRGLFALIEAPTTQSALDVELDALSLLTAAVGVAVSDHAATVNLGSSGLQSLTGLTVAARAAVVEPPSIGIGMPRNGGVPGAKAYNAQVRLHLNVSTTGTGTGLGGLLGLIGTQVHLPIFVDVVNAQGELTDIACTPPPGEASIEVTSSILNLCVGDPIDSNSIFSRQDMCATNLRNDTTFVRLLGINLLHGKVHVPALTSTETVTLAPGETRSTARNPLPVGTTVSTAVGQLLPALLGSNRGGGQGSQRETLGATAAADIARAYFTATQGVATNKVVAEVRSRLVRDGLDWTRPGLLGLVNSTMSQEWANNASALLGGCGSNRTCMQDRLAQALRTPDQCGLVNCILNPVVDLVGSVLGLGASGQQDGGLLQSLLVNLVNTVLKPVLDGLGALLSSILENVLGLRVGSTDVHLHSLSCNNAKLVY